MTKRPLFHLIAHLAMLTVFLFLAGTVLATEPATRGEVENLRERIRALEAEQAPPETPFAFEALGKHLRLGGLLELEASYLDAENGEDSSDLVLATAQLDVVVEINDHLEGYIILLHEEDDTEPIEVDEAAFTLAQTVHALGGEIAFTGGKLYLPFGAFNSSFISDPLTLELGETNNTAAILSWTGGITDIQLGVFNGDTDTLDDNDTIDSWVASVNISPFEYLTFGASWISDLAESDIGLVSSEGLYEESAAGFAAHVQATLGHFTLIGEYVSAADNFATPVVAESEDLSGDQPSAWNAELAFSPEERWLVGLKAERANDFKNDLKRYGAVASYGIFNNTVLAMEYLYGDADGDADKFHMVTAQLAFEF